MGSTRERKGKGIITATPKGKEGADDLNVLNPNAVVPIGGQKITVREYGFIEGLGVRAKAKKFLDDLYKLMVSNAIDAESAIHLISVHHVDLLPLIAQAIDRDMDFISSLTDQDGMILVYSWWAVNGPFFLARVTDRIAFEQQAAQLAKARAGQISMPNSSPTTTRQSK